jgi:KUP system potassium uptake protein
MNKIKGTALFFARDSRKIDPYIARTMFKQNIIYEDNIIVTLIRLDDPFGVSGMFKDTLADGLRRFEIRMGYMTVINVEEILREAGIDEKAIFYGLEDIVTKNLFWRAFSIIKRLTPAYVQFYKLPSEKLLGMTSRVEM